MGICPTGLSHEPDFGVRCRTFNESNISRSLLGGLNTTVTSIGEGEAIAEAELTDRNSMRDGAFEGVVMTSLIDLSASAAAASVMNADTKGYITDYQVKSERVPLGSNLKCITKVTHFEDQKISTESTIEVYNDNRWKSCAKAQTNFIIKPNNN